MWGGFPKIFEFDTEEVRIRYLSDLDDTIVVNNLINRYEIKKDKSFYILLIIPQRNWVFSISKAK